MDWSVPDQRLEPEEVKRPPVCPVCGDDCEYLYRKLFTDDILGCENCIERIYADEY